MARVRFQERVLREEKKRRRAAAHQRLRQALLVVLLGVFLVDLVTSHRAKRHTSTTVPPAVFVMPMPYWDFYSPHPAGTRRRI